MIGGRTGDGIAEGDDLPLLNWKEMWLIRAELEGGQTAIDLVNELRVADGLPPVTYITGATATPNQIKYMIFEIVYIKIFLQHRSIIIFAYLRSSTF